MIIETAIALVLVFGALVMFHELGHFIAARAVGIRVDEFAFGFGPKLIRLFRRGDTEYTVHPVPLGGFVKLAGMEPGEEHIPDGFQAQAAWKRAIVIFSGPAASFLLAVLAFLMLGIFWGFDDGKNVTNRIAVVFPQTVAARLNLRAGDRIVQIDGRSVTSGNEMIQIIHNSAGKLMRLVVKRNGATMRLQAAPAWNIQYAGFDWTFHEPKKGRVEDVLNPRIGESTGIQKGDILISLDGRRIASGEQMVGAIEKIGTKPVTVAVRRHDRIIEARTSPFVSMVSMRGVRWFFPGAYALPDEAIPDPDATLEKLGFEQGDLIRAVDGRPVKSGGALAAAIAQHMGGPLLFKVLRSDKPVVVRVSATTADIAGLRAETCSARGVFGLKPEPVLVKSGSLPDAVTQGLGTTWRIVTGMIAMLAPEKIGESVGGPIMIARQTSSMVALGPYYVILMGGVLSMSLFILNLLPIPLFDGGHLMIMLIESIRRRRLSPHQMQFATLIGIVIIGMLVVTVMWSDIYKITQGQVPQ